MSNGIKLIKGWAVPETDQTHSKWIEETGTLVHDRYITGKLKPYMRQGMHVVDAGAHIGTHALFYSLQVGYDGKVICFEANPITYNCLHFNVGGIKQVELHNVGLGSKSGEMSVAHNPDNVGASFLISGSGIPIITLDSLNLSKCDFIKVDIEGLEPDFLQGASETIQKHKPVMFIEINRTALERNNYTPEDVYRFLYKFGYSYTNITEGEDLNGIQFDIICKPI